MSPSVLARLRLGVAAVSVLVGALAAATTASADAGSAPAHGVVARTRGPADPRAAFVVRRSLAGSPAQRSVPPVADPRARLATARAEARKVLGVAARLRGRPYRWGAAGPHAFDCSGLVQYVFRHALGLRLPRSTWSQWKAVRHIRRGQAKPGDLVYLRNLSHVGIYAGKGYWWVAPHTGARVKKQRIWARHVMFARVIAR